MAALLAAALLIPACSKPACAAEMTAENQPSPNGTILLTPGVAAGGLDTKKLLARPDLTTIEVPDDVSYHRGTRYRAVPIANLLSEDTAKGVSTLQVKAADGFVAEIPLSRLLRRDVALPRAYLAIDDPADPWPSLPGKPKSAGPFYLVWAGPHARQVPAEYWPYQIVSLNLKTDPSVRWAALSPGRIADAGTSARSGQRLFAANCLSCHQIDGEGEGRVGPDLDRPMNPTEYFRKAALHRYIRDPASVRHWPGQQMPAFAADQLSDAQITDIIEYLAAVRHHPPS